MNLTFPNIPAKHESAFAEGVLECLEKLGFTFDYDETSPPSKPYNEVTYKVFGVRKQEDAGGHG